MTDWRPIETAPKDGTLVMLSGDRIYYGWDGKTKPLAVVGQFASSCNPLGADTWQFAWFDGGFYGEYENPTHWMPLPDPPASTEAA